MPDPAGPRLILASASPRRAAILRRMGLDPEIRPAHADERYLPGETPAEHVERLARAKAVAVAVDLAPGGARGSGPSGALPSPGSLRGPAPAPPPGPPGGSPSSNAATPPTTLVVGGDTVVVLEGRVLGKPAHAEDAVAMLMELAGREHEVMTGVAVATSDGLHSGLERTAVRFRPFDEEAARSYVATGEPMDKAGAYGIQGRGAALVEAITGDYDNVVGLPVGLLAELFARAGWRYTFMGLEPRGS